jgi:hypothetical protein
MRHTMKTKQTEGKERVKERDTLIGRVHEATLGGWDELRLTWETLTGYRKA